MSRWTTIEKQIGNTPLIRLRKIGSHSGNQLLLKLEGENPAGSVKDRPALSMIVGAQRRGEIESGDTLVEATSGNTGIALAMVACSLGVRLKLIMPEHMSLERRAIMKAYGAEIILVDEASGMEGARDLAKEMISNGRGKGLDQFANPDNWRAHYKGTGPEIWRDTGGEVTHFVSAMGTTGTIMGCSRYLKEQKPSIQIVGVTPDEESQIAGIRKWPEAYLPAIFEPDRVDATIEVSQRQAEEMARRLAREEGIFAGLSSGGAVAAAEQLAQGLNDALIVAIVCDRGDRYLSTDLFPS